MMSMKEHITDQVRRMCAQVFLPICDGNPEQYEEAVTRLTNLMLLLYRDGLRIGANLKYKVEDIENIEEFPAPATQGTSL